jgi:hypothetical protein
MIIYGSLGKSKPKLAPKKEREEYAAWLKKHGVGVSSTVKTKSFQKASNHTPKIPPGRDTTRHIPSIDSGIGNAPAAPRKVYTGTKIIGIGTLHKSNAVPIFSDEEAKDIAKMRR